jgi:hypothetical protein
MSNTPSRAGWRHFACDECGQQWNETTRDIHSPSGVDCACCGEWVHPCGRSQLPLVKTDAKGNVIQHQSIVMTQGKVEGEA